MATTPTTPRSTSSGLASPVLVAWAVEDTESLLVAVAATDLDTVTGMLDPLTAGRAVDVLHAFPFPGHTSVRFRSLSSGPVGPVSYLHVTPRILVCRGSLSGYRSSPQRPKKESQETGVEISEPTNVPFVEDAGV